MLDFRKTRTTNFKMKNINQMFGILLIAVAISSVSSDISLTLKNQQYLPPSQKFEESKYGNDNYHQFEVHNQLSSINNGNRNRNGNNHHSSSSSAAEEIRIEHINAPPGFPLDNPDLDASLLNVVSKGGSNEIILKHENAPVADLSKVHSAPIPFPSNYQHDFPEKTSENFVDYEEPRGEGVKSYEIGQNTNENQGVNFLPPAQGRDIDSQQYAPRVIDAPLQNNDYLPPLPPLPPLAPLPPPAPSSSGSNNLSPYQVPDYTAPQRPLPATNNNFKPSQYLPPDGGNEILSTQQNREINSHNHIQTPGYLPPTQSGYNQDSSYQNTNSFKGADYLPPTHENIAGPQGPFHPSDAFRGADYLPPRHQQQLSQSHIHVNDAGVKVPGYLPPGYDFHKPANSEQAIAELHTLPDESTNNPNQHQQQHQHVSVQSNIQVSGSQQLGDVIYGDSKQTPGYLPPRNPSESRTNNGYLPPGYDFQKPVEEQQAQQNYQSQSQNLAQQIEHTDYKAAGYLPPRQQSQAQTPGYLPPTPVSQSQQLSTPIYNAPGYLPPTTSSGSGQLSNPSYNAPGYLPPSSSSGSSQLSTPSYNAPGYLPPSSSSGSSQLSTPSYNAPGYLPPTSSHEAQLSSQQSSQSSQSYNAPGYLPPQSTQHSAQLSEQIQHTPSNFNAPGYLPPAGPSTYQAAGYLPPSSQTSTSANHHSSYMHSLSSYMNHVQPYERYGSARKPFPEYGPPPTAAAPISQTTEVSPMYREPSTLPQYYAPGMSYESNSYNAHSTQNHISHSASLSQQARQTLQTFMPQEIRQGHQQHHTSGHTATFTATSSNNQKVSAPAKTSAKVRTVQIVNTNEIKTLKVLESLDHTGVKTIKILGTTHESPVGQHREVRVVSGHEQNVQTVKIYNDQQDYAPNTHSDYLPLRHKRNPKKSKAKGRQRILRH